MTPTEKGEAAPGPAPDPVVEEVARMIALEAECESDLAAFEATEAHLAKHGRADEGARAIAQRIVNRVRGVAAGQRRILILEAPPGTKPIGNVFAQDVVQGSLALVADADEVFVFRGDEAAAAKHRDVSLLFDGVAVAIQRQPVTTDLGPDLTLYERGQTLGDHIGIPLAHAAALRDSAEVVRGDPEQQRLAAEALAEVTEFANSPRP